MSFLEVVLSWEIRANNYVHSLAIKFLVQKVTWTEKTGEFGLWEDKFNMTEGGVDDWWIHGSITFGQGQKNTIKNERLRLWRHCANSRGSRSSDDLVSCFCPQVTRGAVSPEVRGVSTQDRITPRGSPENLPAGAYWPSEIENGQAHF